MPWWDTFIQGKKQFDTNCLPLLKLWLDPDCCLSWADIFKDLSPFWDTYFIFYRPDEGIYWYLKTEGAKLKGTEVN